jgi:hypothetical protein
MSAAGPGEEAASVFSALACPLCSNPPARLAVPEWYVARRTSAKRGARHAWLVGCPHVPAATGDELVAAAAAAALVARWNAAAERLLARRTVSWTAEQRDRFRAALGYPPPVPSST